MNKTPQGCIEEFNLMDIADDCPPIVRKMLLNAYRFGMMRGMNMSVEAALDSRDANGAVNPDVFGQKMLKLSNETLEALPA